MNHKWKNNECIRCGCKRKIICGIPRYFRSGLEGDKASTFECIDWEAENSKTID